MKIYPTQVQKVIEALRAIFEEGHYADRVIERTLKSDRRMGSNDRAFVAENIYELVRWYRLLWEVLGHEPQNEADWWLLFGIRYKLADQVLPDWTEFKGLNRINTKARLREIQADRAKRESIPDWLDQLGASELGEQWDASLQALNQPARVILRVNTLRSQPAVVQEALLKHGIETKYLGAAALQVTQRKNLFRTEPFQKGWFEVQDYSSQQVAPLLQVEPGMRVVDACAGAGGKSLHIASLMENKGQLIALDTLAHKLKQLKQRARRNGVHVVETRPIESRKTIKRLHESADRLLLDVPCSGVGVLRRNPDSKWKLSPEFVTEIRGVQQEILQQYSHILKPGGRMVYATCSILPSENGEQVHKFLESPAGEGFALDSERTILPQEEGFDGFYMAALKRA